MEAQDKTAALIEKELGHVKRLAPTPTAVTICKSAYPIVQSVFGAVLPQDGLFLLSLIDMVQPNHLLELGVMAGGSTLFMLRYISAVCPNATLTSVDALDYYQPDPSKRLAFLVFDNEPTLPSGWTLIGAHGAATFSKASQLESQDLHRRYDFVFVDAHHGHPWPVLDVLCLLPYVVRGCWIALHDVALNLIHEKYLTRGPQYLLQHWPQDKWLIDDPLPNIGAIRLSDSGADDAEQLLKILEIPWEYGIDPYWETAITSHLRLYLTAGQMGRVESAFSQYRKLELAPKV